MKNFGAGYALLGYADSSCGVRGESNKESGCGVHGQAVGDQGYGVSGYAGGENGRGVFGVASQIGQVTNYGGYFEAAGAMGHGVYGLASATGAAKNYGGVFEAKGDSGIGVVAKGPYLGLLCQGDLQVANHSNITCTGNIESQNDLVVKGAYRGTIGPNDGAPFPRPAYDSDWVALSGGSDITLTHDIGDNPDNYVVDLQFFDEDGGYGRNQASLGGSTFDHGHYGAYWSPLTSTSVRVYKFPDSTLADKVRIRIWVYN